MIPKSYLRWRHSKGFGVHSPYAYKFVTDVLRPGPYGYYSYRKVEELLTGTERDNRKFIGLIRFTIRLMVFLNGKRIVATPAASRLAEIVAKSLDLPWKVISLVSNSCKGDFEFEAGDIIIIENEIADVALLKMAIDNMAAIFAINPSADTRNILETPIPRGLLLKDPHKLILIPRREMNYISYDIKLRLTL